ncbi:hypothetical protein LOC59_06395 [Arthrobacter sp. zg-Y916]|uniref:Uncharacterized protein n=1 Tax=Arthrobacter caoxuetaonis TaxID=2886935 RepID=A0A9X1MF83_9MICC|nr:MULTISPECIES: hypothetical protein [Arthrobacter]MCC3299013.1 hypothetical protein [Arthrobacter caoxuetaonis]MCC9193282.1 hypothetical protein [Arthrobacter sp. zg-Y916]USQ58646.1 hypothetical protein NF551_07475 [Arthrobacter caoxuetaonis]
MGKTDDFHDMYIAAWNEGMATGDATPVYAFLAPKYHGWVGQDATSISEFETAEAKDGFAQVVRGMQGSTVHASHRTVGMRGEDEAVVFYEMSYRRDSQVIARALLMESWRRVSGSWKLHRDITELNAPVLEPDIPSAESIGAIHQEA